MNGIRWMIGLNILNYPLVNVSHVITLIVLNTDVFINNMNMHNAIRDNLNYYHVQQSGLSGLKLQQQWLL